MASSRVIFPLPYVLFRALSNFNSHHYTDRPNDRISRSVCGEPIRHYFKITTMSDVMSAHCYVLHAVHGVRRAGRQRVKFCNVAAGTVRSTVSLARPLLSTS